MTVVRHPRARDSRQDLAHRTQRVQVAVLALRQAVVALDGCDPGEALEAGESQEATTLKRRLVELGRSGDRRAPVD